MALSARACRSRLHSYSAIRCSIRSGMIRAAKRSLTPPVRNGLRDWHIGVLFPAMNARTFFTELKRRRVYSVAAAYIVSAWLFIQVATQVFPFFNVASWVVRLVVVLAIIGFPIAVVCSWAFEITPEGIKLEGDVDRRITRKTGRKLTALIVVVAAMAAGLMVFYFLRSQQVIGQQTLTQPATTIESKSIAVLPFENRSEDKANAYFAHGIQDEILVRLGKIADLKVISRTSTQHYKSAPENLRKVGKELGVAHLLEGSVQRTANRVRVNAQLIDARTDAHLWAQTYDRDLADVFAIQSEIARAIAEQLQAKLSPNEKSEIEQPPTIDVTAFDFYSHAKNLLLNASGSSTGKPDLLQAVDLLDKAVARDPSFFDAYCQVAYAHASLYFFDFGHTPARLAAAETAVQRATDLRRDAGETHLARARILYWGHSDYDGALAELETARQRLPSDNWVFSLKGYIERRKARWEESLRDLERAIALDPRNILTLQQTARSYSLLHRYAESKSLLARVLSFEPNDPVTQVLHAFVELDSSANARPVLEVIDAIRRTNPTGIPIVANNWLICPLAERDIAAANNALAACGDNPILLGSNENVIFPRTFVDGVVARINHDEDKEIGRAHV